MEFHISRKSREKYQFDIGLFSLHGNVIFANFNAARQFADKMNEKLDLVSFPENAVKASHINAMGLIDELSHIVIKRYRETQDPGVFQRCLSKLGVELGQESLNQIFLQFSSEFPALAVYQGRLSIDEYLNESNEGIKTQEVVLEEILLLWLSNQNSAFEKFKELFDDHRLVSDTAYPLLIDQVHDFFKTQPGVGREEMNLIDFLLAPARKYPGSLFLQLDYIREFWGDFLGEDYIRLLSSLDFIREEEKPRFFGPGPVDYSNFRIETGGETENFSLDTEWMPRLVLIAKNIYVWLDQLSKKHSRSITRLDQIPDIEFEFFQNMGITGLWLIGVWERSQASSTVKKLCGNPEALASAYSLYSYQIAEDLGGYSAFEKLKNQAWTHGIRMASDMVPNHMGIDSPWVVEHPNWFISLDHSPFPVYSFSGPNLSRDSERVIQIEDHYFSRSDAAVVFRYIDQRDGSTRYIYHGNDGTNMPWNDTAQLNYLMPEVREAVIQVIIQVARQFPIIRFDAAMTLAKRHYQRLWFPEPGSGGDIPSRAEFGMSKVQFDALLPQEFWREVVDRVAVEAPGTLLLAEAFWLMEGYFVRSLGMHRVYNSAFMNLLRDEDNEKYRGILKNTLEFEPEILKRFVNFMNNPDERTAVDQFGKGDKYFGVCTLLATLPGLPMFGHGQIEGFTEKYGMEYRKAYWDEEPDLGLIERHQREIAPLLHNRRIFANVDHFLFYDFITSDGSVNQDVYCYSNREGDHRGLILFNNRYGHTSGWIRQSVIFAARLADDSRQATQKWIHQGLNLSQLPNTFCIFRDQVSNLQYIRANEVLIREGFYFELGAYHYHAFIDFQEVVDDGSGTYRKLCQFLNGSGVPSIDEAIKELQLQPVIHPFREVYSPQVVIELFQISQKNDLEQRMIDINILIKEKIFKFYSASATFTNYSGDIDILVNQSILNLIRISEFFNPCRPCYYTGEKSQQSNQFLKELVTIPERYFALTAWCLIHPLHKLNNLSNDHNGDSDLLTTWHLKKTIQDTLIRFGVNDRDAWKWVQWIDLLLQHANWWVDVDQTPLPALSKKWFANETIQSYLGINRYMEITWYNQEALEEFVNGIFFLIVMKSREELVIDPMEGVFSGIELVKDILIANQKSENKIDLLLELIR